MFSKHTIRFRSRPLTHCGRATQSLPHLEYGVANSEMVYSCVPGKPICVSRLWEISSKVACALRAAFNKIYQFVHCSEKLGNLWNFA